MFLFSKKKNAIRTRFWMSLVRANLIHTWWTGYPMSIIYIFKILDFCVTILQGFRVGCSAMWRVSGRVWLNQIHFAFYAFFDAFLFSEICKIYCTKHKMYLFIWLIIRQILGIPPCTVTALPYIARESHNARIAILASIQFQSLNTS